MAFPDRIMSVCVVMILALNLDVTSSKTPVTSSFVQSQPVCHPKSSLATCPTTFSRFLPTSCPTSSPKSFPTLPSTTLPMSTGTQSPTSCQKPVSTSLPSPPKPASTSSTSQQESISLPESHCEGGEGYRNTTNSECGLNDKYVSDDSVNLEGTSHNDFVLRKIEERVGGEGDQIDEGGNEEEEEEEEEDDDDEEDEDEDEEDEEEVVGGDEYEEVEENVCDCADKDDEDDVSHGGEDFEDGKGGDNKGDKKGNIEEIEVNEGETASKKGDSKISERGFMGKSEYNGVGSEEVEGDNTSYERYAGISKEDGVKDARANRGNAKEDNKGNELDNESNTVNSKDSEKLAKIGDDDFGMHKHDVNIVDGGKAGEIDGNIIEGRESVNLTEAIGSFQEAVGTMTKKEKLEVREQFMEALEWLKKEKGEDETEMMKAFMKVITENEEDIESNEMSSKDSVETSTKGLHNDNSDGGNGGKVEEEKYEEIKANNLAAIDDNEDNNEDDESNVEDSKGKIQNIEGKIDNENNTGPVGHNRDHESNGEDNAGDRDTEDTKDAKEALMKEKDELEVKDDLTNDVEDLEGEAEDNGEDNEKDDVDFEEIIKRGDGNTDEDSEEENVNIEDLLNTIEGLKQIMKGMRDEEKKEVQNELLVALEELKEELGDSSEVKRERLEEIMDMINND